VEVEKDQEKTLAGAEAMILAVPHKQYLDIDPDDVVKWAGAPLALIRMKKEVLWKTNERPRVR
jgi:UDP-N-acetyl-D-mannosaminuronate dehydrogenase